jgi:hypothetical protein
MGKGRDKRKLVEKRRQAAKVPRAEAHRGDLPRGDPEAYVRSPLKPKPGLRSGAIALPEPEESEEQVTIKSARLR